MKDERPKIEVVIYRLDEPLWPNGGTLWEPTPLTRWQKIKNQIRKIRFRIACMISGEFY